MNVIGAYWEELGGRIAAGLRGVANAREALPEIASAALRELRAPSMDAKAVADWAIEPGALPRQVNFRSGFGEPPLVVFETPEFYIEVLFWFPSPTAIHGHGFTGAFVVLDGFSIQVEYAFHPADEPEEGVRLGRLESRAIEFIGPGKVCPILPDEGFIHSVTHLGNPSLTLVVRSFGGHGRQFRYHRCGFAVWSDWDRERLIRQVEVLVAVRTANPAEFPDRLAKLLEPLGAREFYGVFEALSTRVDLPALNQEILPWLTTRFGARWPQVFAAIQERMRSRNIWRALRAFPNPGAQVQAALADAFPDATERNEVLCRSYGVADMAQLPERWRNLVLGPGGASPA